MDGAASVNFTAPANNGAVITSYTVIALPYPSGAPILVLCSTTPCVVNGLTNGTIYTFVAKATNAVGTSDSSTASASIIPAKVPNAPVIDTVTAGLGNATVSIDPSALLSSNSGGDPVVSFTIISSPGNISCTALTPATSCVVAPLVPGTAYAFTAVATNAVGNSLPSQQSNPVIPLNVPDTPTSVLASPSNGAASISFTAPNDNGSPITTYIMTNTATGETFTASSSPVSVSGLTNGTPTTFTVVAVNAVGTSAPATVTVTSRTTPDAPTITGITTGNGTATISVTEQGSLGGAAITSYTVTSSPGGASCSFSPPSTSCSISGLTNGQAYSFSAVANNAAGASPSSAATSGTPSTTAGAPSSVSAVASPNAADVSFTPSGITGGSTVTGYVVTSSPGGITATGSSSPITVTGLTNGVNYTFSVVAVNGRGNSAAGVSNSVTPIDVASAPTNVTAIAQDGAALVSFTAPINNGGDTITSYTVTAAPGGASCTALAPATSCTVPGLTNGTPYTFTVTATNGAGNSLPSAVSNLVTPAPLTSAADATFSLTQNISYTVDLSATGGTAPITYALTGGATSIPGMVLDLNTGVISGTPTTPGTYVETVTATDGSGATVITVATIEVVAPNSHSNNSGGAYVTPAPAPATAPAPAPAPAPIPAQPAPAPSPTHSPAPGPTPAPAPTPTTPPATGAASNAPDILTAINQALAHASVVPVPISSSVELGTPNPSAPAKVLTVASAAGTSLAVIITPQGAPPASYLISVTNNVTGQVTTQLVTGSAITQSIAIAGLNPSATYSVAVIANTASGQALAFAGKVATPAAIAAPATKITPSIIATAAQSAAGVAPFPLSSSTGALIGKANPALASGVVATSSSNGTSLALTVLPPAKAGTVSSYIIMITDRTTGIVTTQQVPAGSNPASMALSNLAPGDAYSVAVVAVDKSGAQSIVTSSAIVMAGKQIVRTVAGGVKLAQTPNTTDSANSPRIVKFVPKAVAGKKNQATVEITNLKPGQRIKVTVQKTVPVTSNLSKGSKK